VSTARADSGPIFKTDILYGPYSLSSSLIFLSLSQPKRRKSRQKLLVLTAKLPTREEKISDSLSESLRPSKNVIVLGFFSLLMNVCVKVL
jgi:hypothetical protein